MLYTQNPDVKKVESKLLSIGINAYCPTRPEIRFWSDRKKKIDVPILPSMILVNLKEKILIRFSKFPLL